MREKSRKMLLKITATIIGIIISGIILLAAFVAAIVLIGGILLFSG